jgi:hypothetical protein
LNLDLFTNNTDLVHSLDVKDKHYTDNLRDYVTDYFNETSIKFIDSIEKSTRVKDL